MAENRDDTFQTFESEFTRTRSSIPFVLGIVGLGLIGIGLVLLRMDMIVRDVGIVRKSHEWYVFAPANGVLAEVAVDGGDFVEKGDFLFSLKDDEVELELIEKRRELNQLRSILERNKLLIKEFEGRPAEAKLVSAQDRLKLLDEVLELQKQNLEALNPLLEQNAVSRQLYNTRQSEYLRTEIQRSETAQWAQWEAAGLIEIEREKLLLENRRRQQEIALLEEEIAINERIRGELRVFAPIRGQVTDLAYKYPGMVVREGEVVQQISDPDSPYRVLTEVDERNVDLIEIGTPVRMESMVFDSVLEGFIYGVVTEVDPLGNPSRETESQSPRFDIEIKVEQTPYPLVLGSRLNVYFMLGKRSLWKMFFNIPKNPRAQEGVVSAKATSVDVAEAGRQPGSQGLTRN